MGVESIVALISQLSNRQRHLLLRRLRVSGLLDDDELLTDKNRLAIAPALSPRQRQADSQTKLPEIYPPFTISQDKPPDKSIRFVAPEPALASALSAVDAEVSPQVDTDATHQEIAGRIDADFSTEYQSPIRGRVVVGSPADETSVDANPHLMPPLPGQAPEQPIGIVFDGGSKGNPGQGYGSYAVDWPGNPQQIVRLQFGDRVTNNEAEYDTLIAALEATIQRLRDQGADPASANIEIRGDSQLVVYQVLGQWKCKNGRMRVRRDRVRELLRHFSSWRIDHHDRSNSVRVLGH